MKLQKTGHEIVDGEAYPAGGAGKIRTPGLNFYHIILATLLLGGGPGFSQVSGGNGGDGGGGFAGAGGSSVTGTGGTGVLTGGTGGNGAGPFGGSGGGGQTQTAGTGGGTGGNGGQGNGAGGGGGGGGIESGGGAGGAYDDYGGGGGGGGGQTALTISSGTLLSGVTVLAGTGGTGGTSSTDAGGGGGGGGIGAVLSSGSYTLSAGSSLQGGAGGTGGAGGQYGGGGGGGGAGGYGVQLTSGTLNNLGSVTGGNGGLGGTAGPGGANGASGAGGAGVYASGATIINSGTIAGGLTGGVQADAVTFAAGTNTLILQAGSSMTGAIDITAPATATVRTQFSSSISNALIVQGSGTFDTQANNVALIGTVSGSGSLTKIGSGTLAITGSNAFAGSAVIGAGTLQTRNMNALGTSAVTLDSGASLAPVGQLNINSLTWNGGSLAMTLGSSPNELVISGSLTNGGSGGTFNFIGGSGFSLGTEYTLLLMGSTSFTQADFSGNALNGVTPTFTLSGSTLVVEFVNVSASPAIGTVSATAANQTIITGGTTAVTVTVANSGSAGTTLNADVTSGTNLSGSGSTTVAAGNTGTATGLTWTGAATGTRTGVFVVSATDATNSPVTGTVSVDVLGHSHAVFTGGGSQSVIVGATGVTTALTLSDGTSGTTGLSPLDVQNPSTGLSGTTGQAVVASGSSATYTATLNTSVTGTSVQTFSLQAGDEQSLPGASALATYVGTDTVTVYGHAAPVVTGSTLDFGYVHAGYTAPVASTNSVTVADGTPGQFIVALSGSGTGTGGVSVNSVTGVAAGGSATISGVLATGQGPGSLGSVTYTFSDDSSLAGASSNVGTTTLAVTGEVYSGQSTWSSTGGGSWGSVANSFGSNWGANQGSPGLDANFSSTDTATFGSSVTSGTATVTLDGVAPSLAGITFSDSTASYLITQGSGTTGITLNGGSGTAQIQDLAGKHEIATSLTLSTTTAVSAANAGDVLTLSGTVTGTGGLVTSGSGTVILAGQESYTGNTTISSGTLQLGNGGALVSVSGSVTDNGTLAFDGSNTAVFANVVSGSGGISQIGTGTTVLSSTDTYTGNTVVRNGRLELTGGAITSGSQVVVGDKTGDNGTLLVASGKINNGSGIIGNSAGSSGTATMTSGTWTNDDLYVGLSGTGSLNISGGVVTADKNINGHNAYIGNNAGSTGSVTVSGGTLQDNFELYVGNNGTGALSVSGSGYVAAWDGFIASGAGSSGTVLVSGGTFRMTGGGHDNLTIGGSGTGILDLTGSGVVDVSSGSIVLGANASGTGTLNIGDGTAFTGTLLTTSISAGQGSGSVVFDYSNSYTFARSMSGNLSVTLAGTGTTILTGASTYTGPTTISLGTLQTQNTKALGNGNVILGSGATLIPQNGLNIGGNLALDGGTMQFALTTTSTTSQTVAVSGSLTGTGATVVLSGSSITAGVQYQLISYTNSNLTASNFLLNNLIPGYTVTGGIMQQATGQTSTVINANGVPVTVSTSDMVFYVTFSVTGGGTYIWNPNGGGTVNKGADYIGNGFTTTWMPTQNNTVNSLTYNTSSGSSSLTVYNTLTVTSGSFAVTSGTTTVTGGNGSANVFTPGNFYKEGAGALVFDPMTLNVAGSAYVDTGTLDMLQTQMVVAGNVNVASGAALNIQQGGSLVAGGTENVGGAFTVQTGGAATVIGALNIASGGVTTVQSGGSLMTGGGMNVSGSLIVQGSAATAGALNVAGGGLANVQSGGALFAGSGMSVSGSLLVKGAAATAGALNIGGGGVAIVQSGGSVAATGATGVSGLFDIQSGGFAAVAGQTTVNSGGVMTVDGALASQQGVLVAQNGLMDGGGVVAGNVTNSGTVLPGDDPAVLTVAGNYTQNNNGTLNIEVAGLNNYGVLVVSGAANISGTLLVTPFNNFQFAYGQQIPNFLVASSVSGSFSTVDITENGFRGRVIQDGGDLSLLIAPSSYTLVAKNPNQYNVAKALDGFIPVAGGDRAVVSTALDFLTASQYPAAFNAIMPDFYQTVTSIGLSMATAEGQIVDQRLGAIRMGSSGFAMQGLGSMPVYNEKGGDGKSAMDGKKDIISQAPDNHWGVWVQGNGIFGHSYSISDVPNYRFESGGFLVGGDYKWDEHFSTGVFTGYQGAYGNYSNGGKVWMNGADFGTYATYNSGDGFYANAILMGGYSNYRVDRSIQFSTINRTASSTPSGGDVAAFLEAGYDFKSGGFIYGPLVNAQYTYLGVAPFTERNAGSLDLSMGSENVNSLQTNFGGHVAYTWILPNKYEIIPEMRMFWNHEFLQNPTGVNASLNGGGGPGFTYNTTTPSRDSVFAGLGVNAQLGSRWNAGAYYNIDFGGSTSITHIVSANLGFSW